MKPAALLALVLFGCSSESPASSRAGDADVEADASPGAAGGSADVDATGTAGTGGAIHEGFGGSGAGGTAAPAGTTWTFRNCTRTSISVVVTDEAGVPLKTGPVPIGNCQHSCSGGRSPGTCLSMNGTVPGFCANSNTTDAAGCSCYASGTPGEAPIMFQCGATGAACWSVVGSTAQPQCLPCSHATPIPVGC